MPKQDLEEIGSNLISHKKLFEQPMMKCLTRSLKKCHISDIRPLMFERFMIGHPAYVEIYRRMACLRKALTHSKNRFVNDIWSNLIPEYESGKGALRWK